MVQYSCLGVDCRPYVPGISTIADQLRFRHGAKVQGLAQSPEVVDGNTIRPFRSDNLASDNNMRVQAPASSSSHRPCAVQSTTLAQKSFERALLLVQGRYDELMCSMDNNERL